MSQQEDGSTLGAFVLAEPGHPWVLCTVLLRQAEGLRCPWVPGVPSGLATSPGQKDTAQH